MEVYTFNCSGKINSTDWQLNKSSLFLQGEAENVMFSTKEYPFSECNVSLFNRDVPASTAILDLNHLSECTDMKLKQLRRYEKYNNLLNPRRMNLYSLRKNVCEVVAYVRSYLYGVKGDNEILKNLNSVIGKDLDDLLFVVKSFLGRLRNIPDTIFHYAASNLGNECEQPEFHMYHMHLELRWMCITLIHAKGLPWNHSVDTYSTEFDTMSTTQRIAIYQRNPDLEDAISMVMDDLVYVSIKLFERTRLEELRQKSPYSCTCMRELWLMLQLFVDELASKTKSKTFWEHVNAIVNGMMAGTKPEEAGRFWLKPSDRGSLECKNPEMFSLWLIYNLSLLYGYNNSGDYKGSSSTRVRPNYEQVDKVLKAYVNKGGKVGERDEIDEELRVMIPLLTVLVCEWWAPRIQVISLLWDCFHRRLDQPFLLQTSGPWSLTIDKKGPVDILKQVKDRVDGNLEQTNESSYGMFLRLLGTLLRQSYSQNDPKHWNQVKGRVYSKFTRSKVEVYSEGGLYNFISLFLTLAVTADTSDVCSVMLDLLPSLPANSETHRKRSVVWKGQLASLHLFAERKLNFENVAKKFMAEVDANSVRKDETSRSMMTSFVDTLSSILMPYGTQVEFNLSEHSFIGGWIERYLLECPKNKMIILITVFINVFKECSRLRDRNVRTNPAAIGTARMLDSLWGNVVGRIRTLVFDPPITGNGYQKLSQLAVCFTLEALKEPATAKRHNQSFLSLFKHFATNIMIKDIRIVQSYLILILQNENAVQELRKELKNFDNIVVQAWVKCCIMGNDRGNSETVSLISHVVRIDQIRQIFQSEAELLTLESSKEPVIEFIKALMRKWNALQKEQERASLSLLCRLYFNNLEKWAQLPSTEETTESIEFATWIYRCIGTLILCCSPMIYVKNQPNMLMNVIKRLILPSEKSTPECNSLIMKNGKKIFSLTIVGIGSLDVKSDITLQMMIKNLFEQYLPLLITETTTNGNCKISESLLKCFCDASVEYVKLILKQLAVNFIIYRDSKTHEHCYLVMLLLRNLLKSGKSYGCHVPEIIISTCLPHIITCYMKVYDFHVHKQQTIQLISDLSSNPYYKEITPIRDNFKVLLSNSVQQYLTVYPKSLFEFISSLLKVNTEMAEHVLPQIQSCVTELEAKRKPNAASLRSSLNQLQGSLQSIK